MQQVGDTNTVERLGAFEVPVFARHFGQGAGPDGDGGGGGENGDGDGVDARLSAAILARMQLGAGEISSNEGGGWHSRRDLHTWREPVVATFLERIEQMLAAIIRATTPNAPEQLFEGWLISAWANVNGKGASNRSHSHFWSRRRALWSGVYYVDPGSAADGEDISGRTIFEDRVLVPRPLHGGGAPFAAELAVVPRAGTMVMFPATLAHRVEPYRGEAKRITLAWNLYHPGFAIPLYDDESLLAGITLPARWTRLKPLARRLPLVGKRISWARPPMGEDLARPLDQVLDGSMAGPLRRAEPPVAPAAPTAPGSPIAPA